VAEPADAQVSKTCDPLDREGSNPSFGSNKGGQVLKMETNAKIRVLIVDDNKGFCDFISSVFGEEFEVQVMEDGEQGLAKCAEWRPDLVLLDINLPALNGIEFLRRMALDEAIASIPVIVVTASDYNGITESLAKRYHNMAAFMTKLSPVETIREKMLQAASGRK
jgi:CheY-like chemotaxis protein